ncbi:VOC family protein [Bradyrhizobium sp. UFLA05-109]
MSKRQFTSTDSIRTMFSRAMSNMYRLEVPQYGTLLEIVAEANAATRSTDPVLNQRLVENDEIERLALERHGAIRLGTAAELSLIRRLFDIMGMLPVGYYDLSTAGVPVHSTAFRPVTDEALRRNPFRVFTSLLRLELISDLALREEARAILSKRTIYTPGCLELIETAERNGGLVEDEAVQFVAEALETFRWHSEATVEADVYHRLRKAHPLIADVVCFKGPHINHLTPRTLDIDSVQAKMPERGIAAKALIEGPPKRQVPILLRQTSFKALEEPIAFKASSGQASVDGTHTARFGEIEQRGIALTRKGRDLYDRLLTNVRAETQGAGDGSASAYMTALERHFSEFPDDEETLRKQGLAYFRYSAEQRDAIDTKDIESLLARGAVKAEPIIYEDFLPVSAAGIFQSNLGDEAQESFAQRANRSAFEEALGRKVLDELKLYEAAEAASISVCLDGGS